MPREPEFASLEGRALHPASWLLVARDAAGLEAHRAAVTRLMEGGHTVAFAHFDRLPGAGPGLPVDTRRVSAVHNVPRRARRPARAVELLMPQPYRARLAVRRDQTFTKQVAEADHVLSLDELSAGVLESWPRRPKSRHWGPAEVTPLLEEELWWRYLDRRLHQLSGSLNGPLQAMGLMEAVRWLAQVEPRRMTPPPDLHRLARSMIHRLVGRGRLDDARALLLVCERAEPEVGPGADAAAFLALRTHLRLHDEQVAPEALQSLAADVFASADAALAEGAPRDAAGRASIGLDLMFHPRLHTDVPRTPLVESPETFTAPLYGSEVGRLLTRPGVLAVDDPQQPRTATATTLKVTYLPGAYPWHASRVLSALDADPRADLSVLRLTDAAFQGMSIGELFVSYRLSRALPESPHVASPANADLAAELEWADVVVADWADKGALWASLDVPTSTRMVVRVHSADVLSAGVHLVDWSRVSDVICVSEHLRQVFVAVLGERAKQLRVHVIPNILAPFASSPPETATDGRTIAMVGWGQKVKDPVMALDVLAALRTRDPSWRMRLIGADFGPSTSGLVNDYTTAFRRRSVGPDVAGAIDFIPQTDDVPAALAGSSFILSTSLRESFHIGAMEGIAAGAVPVIREWPAFAKYHGAAGLFPAWAVFDTVDEAVEIIWSLREPAARQAALERARESMRAVLDGERTVEQLLDVILR